jgi:hypothetical protein
VAILARLRRVVDTEPAVLSDVPNFSALRPEKPRHLADNQVVGLQKPNDNAGFLVVARVLNNAQLMHWSGFAPFPDVRKLTAPRREQSAQ